MKLVTVFCVLLMGTIVAGEDTIGDCNDKLVDLDGVRNNPNAVCPHFKVYVKCIIRVVDLVNMDGAEDSLKGLENELNEKLREGGINCNIDIRELTEEVKAENAGSTTSPISWLVVMVTSFLVMLQQL